MSQSKEMSRKVVINWGHTVGLQTLIVDALRDVGKPVEPLPMNDKWVEMQKSMLETIERAQRDIFFGPRQLDADLQVKFESTQPKQPNDWVRYMWGSIPIKHEMMIQCCAGDWHPRPLTNMYAYAWENHKVWVSKKKWNI